MPKNIALFIDGTWNYPRGRKNAENTNVRKLYELCKGSASHQELCYLRGVGTLGSPPFPDEGASRGRQVLQWLSRPLNVLAGATGGGTSNRIVDAYQFLCRHYQPGDHIYLFGFSRGAFAARSLAGFVDHVGILLRERLESVDGAYWLYRHAIDTRQSRLREFLYRITDGREGADDETALPIHFIGVWDTVAALGLPRRASVLSDPYNEYHQTDLPYYMTHARHALAIHELRGDFRPLLWHGTHPHNPNQTLKQTWFAGAHADVGGGYREADLSDNALAWMIGEATAAGLAVSAGPQASAATVRYAPLHHEIRGVFAAARPRTREALALGAGVTAGTVKTFRLDRASFERVDQHCGMRPYRFFRPAVNRALQRADDLGSALHRHHAVPLE